MSQISEVLYSSLAVSNVFGMVLVIRQEHNLKILTVCFLIAVQAGCCGWQFVTCIVRM